MIAFPKTRALATIALASALALPAYTCDGHRAPTGEVVESIPAGADSASYTPARIPHRPIQSFDPTLSNDWIRLLSYTWPILVLGLRLRGRPALLDRVLHWAELVCAPASALTVYYIAETGRIAYGSYIAFAAIAMLFVATILEFVQRRSARGSG